MVLIRGAGSFILCGSEGWCLEEDCNDRDIEEWGWGRIYRNSGFVILNLGKLFNFYWEFIFVFGNG